jgi:hypothetical protein
MSEPRRYTPKELDEIAWTALGDFILADDPAILEWKRDSEALDWLEGTVGQHDHVRLERIGVNLFVELFNDDQPEGEMPYVVARFHAPTLLSAIEQAQKEGR